MERNSTYNRAHVNPKLGNIGRFCNTKSSNFRKIIRILIKPEVEITFSGNMDSCIFIEGLAEYRKSRRKTDVPENLCEIKKIPVAVFKIQANA